MFWNITFIDLDARTKVRTVESATRDGIAAQVPDIPSSRILDVRVNRWRTLWRDITTDRPGMSMQASFLASYAAAIAGGQDQADAMNALSRRIRKFRSIQDRIESESKPSAKLRIMNFDPQVVLLAQIGEQSGRLPDVIGQATDDVILRNNIASEAIKRLAMPFILTVMAIAVSIYLPLSVVPEVRPVFEMDDVDFQTTAITDFLFALEVVLKEGWMGIVLALAGLTAFIVVNWRKISKYPPFSMFSAIVTNRRAVMFLLSFSPLYRSGVKAEEAFEMLSTSTSGRTQEIYAKILDGLRHGKPLSKLFDREEWPPGLVDAMAGFDDVTPSDAHVFFDKRIRPLAMASLQRCIDIVVAVMGSAGFILAVSSLLMIIIGLTFPVMSANPNMTGL